MSLRVFAPAKVNLTLQVGRPRADGLHPLQSVVAFANIGDVIDARPSGELSLEVDGPFASALNADASNLVMRATHLLADAAGLGGMGARLRLEKNLPVAAGLGGGSSDAAAALKALNALWELNWPQTRLEKIATALGADVPVCLGARSAYMVGAGERFSALELPTLPAVLVNPLKPLPTADVYRRFDAMSLGGDFVAQPPPSWRTAAEVSAAIAAIGNGLEAPARALLPELESVRMRLESASNVCGVGLSGSGATMFALFESMEAAAACAAALARDQPWWAQAARLAA